jgi:putative chitinase
MITAESLTSLMPQLDNVDVWVAALNKVSAEYEINDNNRLSIFLSQTMFESNYFVDLVEDLNYSASALLAVFPKYFPSMELASQYARQPEKIAAHVYANRMGNGDEASVDGWTYRGRGLIQITGKANYTSFANSMNMSLDDAVSYLETPEGAAMGAGWFWSATGLNDLADQEEFTKITQKINGGLTGLPERKAIWNKVQTILV